MTVTQKLMAAGAWQIQLSQITPRSILDQIDITSGAFGLVVITSNRIDPSALSDYTSAQLRAVARYVGVYRSRPSTYSMAGAGLNILLGDEDGKGPILSSAITRSAGTLTNWISDLLTGTPNGISAGTVTNTGTNHTQTYQYVAPRAALEVICEACAAEYRLNNDLTLDAAAASSLWTWTPTVLAMKGSDGRDQNVTGITSVEMAAADDCEDYSSKVYVLATADGGTAVGTATAGTIPYYGPGGSTIRMERVVNASSVARGDETNVATQQLARFSSLRRACSITVDDPDIMGKIRPGDRMYVYDPTSPGLYDFANQVAFRGQDISPAILRVLGYTWPIREGYGVYFVTPASSPSVYDLSGFVLYETGDVRMEIGAIDRPLFNSSVATGNLNKANPIATMPRFAAADAWTSYTPTYTNLTLGNGTVDAGYTRIGRTVTYRGSITFGTTTSVGGSFQVSLPIAAKAATWSLGSGSGTDASASFARTTAVAEINPAVFATGINFTNTGNSNWNATTPFTWTTSDVLTWTITYEAAAS